MASPWHIHEHMAAHGISKDIKMQKRYVWDKVKDIKLQKKRYVKDS